jgi:hypothetical protein
MKKRFVIYIMVSLAFLFTCAVVAGGVYYRAGSDTYALTVGLPSNVTLFALYEVPDEVTTEANRIAALDFARERYEDDPIRTIDTRVWTAVLYNLNALFTALEDIRVAYAEEVRINTEAESIWIELYHERIADAIEAQAAWDTVRDALLEDGGDVGEMPPRPEIPDEEWLNPPLESLERFNVITVFFTEEQQLQLMYMSGDDMDVLWEATWAAAQNVQTRDIREWELAGERERVLMAISRYIDTNVPDRIINEIAYTIVSHHVQPNFFINQYENENRRLADEDNYERVVVMQGESIVTEGVIVTERAYRILANLGYIGGGETDWRDDLRSAAIPLSGRIILIAALFFGSLMYLRFYRSSIAASQKEAGLLFILYIMVLALLWVLREQNYPFLPLLVFPMLVSVLIDRRCAILLSVSFVLIGYFVVDGSLAYLLFYSISGILICLLSRYTTQRSNIIMVGFLITAIQFALSVAIAFALERNLILTDMQGHLTTAGFAAVNGLLTVIICMGSLPFWEALFGVVTPIKLLDLTNPTNLLLRRLTIEAPGTYHHSLMVANLAESAAYDIGANAHAARVGGYYHDVGKLKFPHFFVENINGENPHEHLEPHNSAALIISHVTFGLTLAAQHRLPQFVRDIIREHHGTSLMQYFYVKAKELDPEIIEEDYRYPYTIPQTRESACVMLADTVEAAVRAMIPKLKSINEIEDTIRDLIRFKLNDGQLADSQLSIKDVAIIEASFLRVLKGTHHERIVYPKLEPDDTESLVIRGMVRKD